MSSTHPRPQLRRKQWRSLEGRWRFAYDDQGQYRQPDEVIFDREIVVPYPPESQASGIGDIGFHPVVWYSYRLGLEASELPKVGQTRLILHFGAVDYAAKVWVNGFLVATHEGGHTPFSTDISDFVQSGQAQIVVRAEDDPHDLGIPRGKQDWQPKPHVIWYPRTTGIWQPVWLETVPATRVHKLHWTPNLERFEIALSAQVAGQVKPHSRLRVRLSANGQELSDDSYALKGDWLERRITLPDPGIDDERNHLMWRPEHPTLIEAEVELLEGEQVLDSVQSYTALRSVGIDQHRFTLNGWPYPLRMVLDQGYWPASLMSASDEQLRRDVELTKMLGFNGVRKHQKIEDPRWLYWCDKLGLLVWEEMPSHYRFSPEAVGRLTREWMEVLERDRSHPCIVAWVPFNESWGVPDLTTHPAQQHYVSAIYHLTKTLDPSRFCIGNDGWDYVLGDWIGIHDYSSEPAKLLERYGTPESIQATLLQPWGRALTVQGVRGNGEPVVLSEFGGIAFTTGEKAGWGYSRVGDSETFLNHYAAMLEKIHQMRGIAGFCYTQLTDTFQEKNGLLTEERKPKADFLRIAAATRGQPNPHQTEMEGEANPMGYSRRWFKNHTDQPMLPPSPVKESAED